MKDLIVLVHASAEVGVWTAAWKEGQRAKPGAVPAFIKDKSPDIHHVLDSSI